jgi:hypothetical protein
MVVVAWILEEALRMDSVRKTGMVLRVYECLGNTFEGMLPAVDLGGGMGGRKRKVEWET